MIGELRLFPIKRHIEGHVLCDGRELPIKGNEALYSVIGLEFGGNPNAGTFCVPNYSSGQSCLFWHIDINYDDYPLLD
jgi:microcystin-dependent protein